jgi:hypothetical protein
VCAAQDTSASPQASGSKILVTLEQGGFTDQQLPVCLAEKDEIQQQKAILIETLRLKDEQNVILKNLVETQKKVSEAKDTLHAAELKAAKPTFWDNLGKIGIGIGVGIVLTVGVVLLL